MTLYKWSQTAAADATADSTINWAEGQAPSSVNDSARAMMVATAKYRDDVAGAIVTSGTNNSYTVSSYQVFDTLAHLNSQMIAFTPHVTNGTIATTLNVDGLGARPLRTSPGVELLAGMIIQGTPYVATYNNTDGAFYLRGFMGNPYNIPLGAGLDYWGTTAPNSCFAFPLGQALSRTAFSLLFALFGTTYGAGDGSTTFNIPNKGGRVSAMLDQTASVLNSFSVSPNAVTLGATGGTQSSSLVTANLPPYMPSGSVSVVSSANVPVNPNVTNWSNGTGITLTAFQPGGQNLGQLTSSGSLSGNAQGGSSQPFSNVQPSILCNYILRIF